jgi:chromosome segregation and condensation protein ScpB
MLVERSGKSERKGRRHLYARTDSFLETLYRLVSQHSSCLHEKTSQYEE